MLNFSAFEPQKMLIQCVNFALTNTKFRMQIGKIVHFWQHGSFLEHIWIHYCLNMQNFCHNFCKKDYSMHKFDFGQPQQMLRKCLKFRDFDA